MRSSQDAVELLSDKWRIALLHLLTPGPQRAKTLQKAISKISLQSVETDSSRVSRKPYPSVLPRAEYQLTEMGASVIEPLKTLCLWAHAEERDRARGEFDAREKIL